MGLKRPDELSARASAHVHTGIEHVIHVQPRTGATMTAKVYLPAAQLADLLAPIRTRAARSSSAWAG